MRAKDAEWVNKIKASLSGEEVCRYTPWLLIGDVEDKLDAIEQEFAALQAENDELRSRIKDMFDFYSVHSGTSEKPTDHGKVKK